MCTIFLLCLIGQHSLSLATSVTRIRLLVQPVSPYLPRKSTRGDTHKVNKGCPLMATEYQNRLTSLLCFRDENSNFFTTHAVSILNDGTARNVDAVSWYLRLVLWDGGKRGC